jgi:hypothetical protein
VKTSLLAPVPVPLSPGYGNLDAGHAVVYFHLPVVVLFRHILHLTDLRFLVYDSYFLPEIFAPWIPALTRRLLLLPQYYSEPHGCLDI